MWDKELTSRQKEVYDFLCACSEQDDYHPSVRDICRHLNLSSPSTVHAHLKTLEKKGLIYRAPGNSHFMRVIKPEEESEAAIEELTTPSVKLPLLGNVAAGQPIFAEECVEEYLDLPERIVSDAADFILRVRGDSMIDIGILDGDFVVVRSQNHASNGEVVVALIDDSATVKTFYHEGDQVRLQPENESMDPIIVRADECHILGKITGLFRSF